MKQLYELLDEYRRSLLSMAPVPQVSRQGRIDEARLAIVEAFERNVLTLHGFEIMSLVKFLGGEPDTDVSIAHFDAAKDVETGEDMPAGHYAWCTEYPEEGRALLSTEPPPEPNVIELTPAEIQSGHDRVAWAEGLIRQLPETHDGRNSWLLNYGKGPIPCTCARIAPTMPTYRTTHLPECLISRKASLLMAELNAKYAGRERRNDSGELIPRLSEEP